MTTCASCSGGYEVDGEGRCPGCGLRTVPPTPSEPPRPRVSPYCPSCGQQLSPEAAFCAQCGGKAAAAPTGERGEDGRFPWQPAALFGGLALAAVVSAFFLFAGGGSLDGQELEGTIEQRLTESLDGKPVTAECPNEIDQDKGKITDCTATLPSGRVMDVFVEQVDDEGHIRIQPDPQAMLAEIQAGFGAQQ